MSSTTLGPAGPRVQLGIEKDSILSCFRRSREPTYESVEQGFDGHAAVIADGIEAALIALLQFDGDDFRLTDGS